MRGNRKIWKRAAALVLAAALLLGIAPLAAPEAQAAEWMEPYLNQVVDWGVMRGDANGNLNPDAPITRAQFVTMVNRAFGYTDVGPNPFTDVPEDAWFANDIRIARQAGYFNGTSATTASPNALVTREQAAVLIGRNLRLQGNSYGTTPFTDDQQMGSWSRDLVRESAEMGIILGYEDGSFRPKANVTRGQVACFLVRALGSLIHEAGDYDYMGVYGNLAINAPGVTLRNAVITGNLYLTGGVGLGDLVLENVDVQGRIIIAGGGEAQGGQSSIMLRNVTADHMDVDSIADQFVTIRSEGLTNIGTTSVRTQGYLEDVTEDGLGLKEIRFEAEAGARLDLAGNIKEFINLTPDSTVNLAQGVVQKATVDEKAAGATINVDGSTTVEEFNLDVGTTVSGSGDVAHMNVNASGTTSSILPDTIFVRPGIISNIKGQQMDSVAAEESSEDPRLLAGYPAVRNVASRSATAVFSTNKAGTLYWGVSALTDGSLGEEELTTTSSTANPKVIRRGTVNITAGKTEATASITGLTVSGSYYVSALLQDNRGQRSAVKVTAFVTPDDTTPAFVTGYPEAILAENDEGEQIIQARVMANKSCQLYYALMPNNSTAPTAADFKSNSLSGNLGHGVVELRKNVPWLIPQVNSSHLREETDYDLYLWLTDADGARSSAVRKLDIRTLDKTPPMIQDLRPSGDATATSVPMQVSMNEPGTLYWAVVKEGAPFYKQDATETDPLPNTENAKMQIETGLGALRKGSVTIGQADTPVNFNITGLAAQTGYDLYFVAKDRAGNYCVFPSDDVRDELVPPMQIRTMDGLAPTVKQEFSPDGETLTPHADNSIQLVFSERVQGVRDVNGRQVVSNFLELYDQVVTAQAVGKGEKEAKDALGEALAHHITLHRVGSQDVPPRDSSNENQEDLDWIVDFRKALVEMDPSGSGEMIVTLPRNASLYDSGLNLASGATYYFTLTGIQDMSGNQMEGVRGVTTLPRFRTLSATVDMAIGNTMELDDGTVVDLSFTMTPNGTGSVADGELWDLLLWTDKIVEYDLYSRTQSGGNWGPWNREGSVSIDPTGGQNGWAYTSLMNAPGLRDRNNSFDRLNTMTDVMEFALHVNRYGSSTDRTSWNVNINMRATVVSGPFSALRLTSPKIAGVETDLTAGTDAGAEIISIPDPFNMVIPFSDSRAPVFEPLSYPQVEVGDISATLEVTLDRDGTVYYAVAPVSGNRTGDSTNYGCPILPSKVSPEARPALGEIPEVNPEAQAGDAYPGSPAYQDSHPGLELSSPAVTDLTRGITNVTGVISGNSKSAYPNGITGKMLGSLQIEGLSPMTTYILYIVTQGTSPVYSEHVMAYQFTTLDALLPKIDITRNSNTSATISVNRSSDISYALVPTNSLTAERGSPFAEPFSGDMVNEKWTADVRRQYPGVQTVLDAMLTGCYSGRTYLGSVYDIYGNEPQKSTYADLISQTASGGVTDVAMTARDQRVTVAPNASSGQIQLSPMTGMNANDWYTLLVVGHTINGSGNAFRASRSYYNTSKEYLRVTDCQLTATTDSISSLTPTCSGTLLVNFSDSLQIRTRDSSTGAEARYPLDGCVLGDSRHTGSNNVSGNGYVNIGSVMNTSVLGNGSISLLGAAHDSSVGQALRFDVKNVRAGSRIFFQSGLCGVSHNVREGQTLTVTINYAPPAIDAPYGTEGTWSATFSPESWGRTTLN